jgi:electron transfer flavoprotein alpha/beta subunit
MEARNKPMQTWGAADIGAAVDMIGLAGSPTQVTGIFKRDIARRKEILEGTPSEISKKAVMRLQELLIK